MSRLDQHVGLVRTKLAIGIVLRALAFAGIGFAALVALAVLVERQGPAIGLSREHVSLPRPMIWFWIGLGLTVLAPIVYTIVRWPTARQAAVLIDERLGLMEQFSTALYMRSSRDPFAAAAVHGAEGKANSVMLGNRFPVRYPMAGLATILLALAVTGEVKWVPQHMGTAEANKKINANTGRPAYVPPDRNIRRAIAEIDAAPPEVLSNEKIQMARKELSDMMKQPVIDSPRAQAKAEDTLKQIASIKQKIADAKNYATATEEMSLMKNVGPPAPEETGPVSDAHRALAEGKLDEAVEDLKKTVDNFNKMSQKEQEKAADQMQKLAQQMAQQANNPQVQQQIQKQLQQAGMSQQAAQQMSQQLQQAANGNQQAQQNLQKMMNNAIQQANQQAGQSQKQQQAVAKAIQQAVQKAQQQANGQANAQQMSQTTQNLAKAMQQAAKGQQGAQKQGSQQAKSQGGKQGGQQNQGQQAQANGQQQAGQQAGGQQGASGQGQSAQQQMQQQVAQLQAMAKDAQAVAAGQQGASQGQQGQNPGQGQPGQGQQQANGQWGPQQQGQQGGQPGQQGQQPGQNNGQFGAGGLRPDPVAVPYATKQELSPSQTIDTGKIIAKSYVKAPAEKGTSHVTLSQAVESSRQEDAGEVETDRIPRSAQKAVKDYFDTLKPDQAK